MSDHENYYKVLVGIIKLHGLDLLGMNDSDEAEQVRDTMDKPHHLLPREYIDELCDISAMLNGISDRYRGNNPIP
jgi:hypothetical protein